MVRPRELEGRNVYISPDRSGKAIVAEFWKSLAVGNGKQLDKNGHRANGMAELNCGEQIKTMCN